VAKAYSYLRFSTPEQAKGDSTRRQSAAAEAYAVKHGLDLDNLTYRDLGVSGFRGSNVRSGALGQFLKAVDEGFVPSGSYLLVESLDRVSRQKPWDALPVFQQIINAGVTIVTLQDERVWSREELQANPFRMFESLLVMVRAHEESATKGRRVRAAWVGKRATAATKPLTARGPAWLRLVDGQWQVIDERAAVVRRIYQMTAEGAGQNAVAAALNGERVPTFGDGPRKPASHWHRSYVVKLLRSPSVGGTLIPHTVEHEAGKRLRKPQAAVEGYYPEVVPRELYERVQALRMDTPSPQRGRHAAGPMQNVLGGLARCPHCHGTMTRVTKGAKAKAGALSRLCEGEGRGRV
jgi:DNA invertase Pin-like site-specific DNA recombinase